MNKTTQIKHKPDRLDAWDAAQASLANIATLAELLRHSNGQVWLESQWVSQTGKMLAEEAEKLQDLLAGLEKAK